MLNRAVSGKLPVIVVIAVRALVEFQRPLIVNGYLFNARQHVFDPADDPTGILAGNGQCAGHRACCAEVLDGYFIVKGCRCVA